MDYVALQHNSAGVHYNSPNKIGGIRYYNPKYSRNKRVKKSSLDDSYIVEIDDLTEPSANRLTESEQRLSQSSESLDKVNNELDEVRSKLNQRANIIANRQTRKSVDLVDEYKLEQEVGTAVNIPQNADSFVVEVAGELIDFAAEGIPPAKLSEADSQWLLKARYYFLNAREGNRKIGSAEAYTTPEVLYALWSTAEYAGIDPKRFLVQLYNETRFNPNLVGRAGEHGIGQFKKATAERLGYNWDKMRAGTSTYAYQAKASAEFIAQVGEQTYNGSGAHSERYVQKISRRLEQISQTRPPRDEA